MSRYQTQAACWVCLAFLAAQGAAHAHLHISVEQCVHSILEKRAVLQLACGCDSTIIVFGCSLDIQASQLCCQSTQHSCSSTAATAKIFV